MRVLGKMTDVIVRLLSIIFERLCQLGEVSNNGGKVNVVLVFKKSKKEGLGWEGKFQRWENGGAGPLTYNTFC